MKNELRKDLLEVLKQRLPEITLSQVAMGAGIAVSTLYSVAKDPNYNMGIKNIERLYKYLLDQYGIRLAPWEYLNITHYTSGYGDEKTK